MSKAHVKWKRSVSKAVKACQDVAKAQRRLSQLLALRDSAAITSMFSSSDAKASFSAKMEAVSWEIRSLEHRLSVLRTAAYRAEVDAQVALEAASA